MTNVLNEKLEDSGKKAKSVGRLNVELDRFYDRWWSFLLHYALN